MGGGAGGMTGGAAGGRRFWREAAAVADPDGSGWSVRLDGKALRLPGGAVLRMREQALAGAVAAEWAAAGGGEPGTVFAAEELRLTQLASARQERVAPDRARMEQHLLRWLDGDALRYRAEAGEALRVKQDRLWGPWVARWEREHGAALPVVAGVMPSAAGEAATVAARLALRAASEAELAALAVLVPATGSLLLGMAVVEGALDGREALELSLLDEHDQQARWGTVAETERREATLDGDVAAAERFLALCRAGAGGAGMDGGQAGGRG